MKKIRDFTKYLKHQRSVTRHSLKTRSSTYKENRQRRLILRRKKSSMPNYVTLKAPENFSFIDNTENVLEYFIRCRKAINRGYNVRFDISHITNLSSDSIALLAAFATDKSFNKGRIIKGNCPQDSKLGQLFVQSGFYKFVNAKPELKNAQNQKVCLFHQENNIKVQPKIARNACNFALKRIVDDQIELESLYEILVEAMSNTNNHANKRKTGLINWWLYTYNAPNGNTIYTFIDLGVGIFDSIPVIRFKKFMLKAHFLHNASLAKPLLNGDIKSSKQVDNSIRGKGIPQIYKNCRNTMFYRAYIVSNDVKIDLKTGLARKMPHEFLGTMLHFELKKV